jgi:pimeloyl-ACP methyl ester carboxylesterase
MPSIRTNATELYYETIGRGPPLLLIHGLGSSGDDWAFQRDDLARTHTLILPDLRGSGRSAKPRGPYSIAQSAAALWGLLDVLDIETADVLAFRSATRSRSRWR